MKAHMQYFVLLLILMTPYRAHSEESQFKQNAIDGLVKGKVLDEKALGVKEGWTITFAASFVTGCETKMMQRRLRLFTKEMAKAGGQTEKDGANLENGSENSAQIRLLYSYVYKDSPYDFCECQMEHFSKRYLASEVVNASNKFDAVDEAAMQQCANKEKSEKRSN